MSHHNLQKGALINGLRCWILRRLWRRENRCIRVGAFHTVGYHLAGRNRFLLRFCALPAMLKEHGGFFIGGNRPARAFIT
jgi:hypothetical protein